MNCSMRSPAPMQALSSIKRLLVERTEGNPFYLEESVRTLVETGALAGERGAYRLTRPVKQLKMPATVQSILAACIDRLGPEAKRLLQAAGAKPIVWFSGPQGRSYLLADLLSKDAGSPTAPFIAWPTRCPHSLNRIKCSWATPLQPLTFEPCAHAACKMKPRSSSG